MHSKKILLVEDSALPQMIAKALLQPFACRVDIAATGEESVALCLKNHYDLIFMDIGLPGIDGILAAQRIRAQEKQGCRVPIIALTAHNDPTVKTKAVTAGMDDYLVKPLTEQSVRNILNKYFSMNIANTSPIKKRI